MFVGFQETGALDEIFTGIGGVIESLIPTLETVFETLGEIFEAFGPVVVDVLGRLGEIFGKLMEMIVDSGLLDTISEVVGLIADSLLDAIEGLMPLIESAFGLFADVLNVVLPLIAGLIDGIITAGTEILTFGAYNDNINEIKEAVDELTESWDELTEAEQRATLAEMKKGLEAVRDLCGENSEEFAMLQAEILEFEASIGSSKQTMDEWTEVFRGDMLESVEIGSGAWDEMMEDARKFGEDFAENNKNMHNNVMLQTKSANQKEAELAREGMRGFIEQKQSTWQGVGEPAMQAVRDELFNIIANPDDYREMGAQGMHQHLYALADQWGIDRAKIHEVEDELIFMLGLEGQAGDIGTGIADDMSQALKNYNWQSVTDNIVSQLDYYFSVNPVTIPGNMTVEQYQAQYGMYHTGGMIKAHSGLLAPDEVMIRAQKGEGIINRMATQFYGGKDFINALNSLSLGRSQNITVYNENHSDVDVDRALTQLAWRIA